MPDIQTPGAEATGNEQPTGEAGGNTAKPKLDTTVTDQKAVTTDGPVSKTQLGDGGQPPQGATEGPKAQSENQARDAYAQVTKVPAKKGNWFWPAIAGVVFAIVLAVFLTGTFMRNSKAKALPTFTECGSFHPKDPTRITAQDLKSFSGVLNKGETAPSGRKIISCSEGVQVCTQALAKGVVSACDFSSCTCTER